MNCCRTFSISTMAGVMAFAGLAASGQEAKGPENPPAKAVEGAVQQSEAKAILRSAREAWGKVKSVTFKSRAEHAPIGDRAPTIFLADVAMERAEAGWKVSSKGELKSGEAGKGRPFQVAFDGVTARSVRSFDREVVESGGFTDQADLMAFFSAEKASPPIVWELLTASPLASADGATLVFEGKKDVDGESCDAIRIEPRQADRAKGIDPIDAAGGRYYFGVKDGILRRVERFRPKAAGPAGNEDARKVIRTVTFSDFAINKGVSAEAFVVSVPEGFEVKADERKVRAEKAAKAAKEREESAKRGGDNNLLAVGSVAPDWSHKDATGKEVKLADLKGKVVLMDFWATWCGPCKAVMPDVQRIHDQYKDKNVVVLGMNAWERDGDPAKYMKDNKFTYGLVMKADSTAQAYKVSGIPTFYLIGPDGKILYNAVGAGPEHGKTIRSKIDAALAEMAKAPAEAKAPGDAKK
jgi:thiol-disulfide isomerase/thioredoxin